MKKRIEPWAIGVPLFLVFFATCMISFAVWTVGRHDPLVSEDYYAKDLVYQERIEQTQRARELKALTISEGNGYVRLAFSPAPETGVVRLYRPSNATLDESTMLSTEASQELSTADLERGLWTLQVEWLANGESLYMEDTLMLAP